MLVFGVVLLRTYVHMLAFWTGMARHLSGSVGATPSSPWLTVPHEKGKYLVADVDIICTSVHTTLVLGCMLSLV